MSLIETSSRKEMPDLATWEPNYKEVFYIFDNIYL